MVHISYISTCLSHIQTWSMVHLPGFASFSHRVFCRVASAPGTVGIVLKVQWFQRFQQFLGRALRKPTQMLHGILDGDGGGGDDDDDEVDGFIPFQKYESDSQYMGK